MLCAVQKFLLPSCGVGVVFLWWGLLLFCGGLENIDRFVSQCTRFIILSLRCSVVVVVLL